ncbi:HEAT repeat protein-like protein [Lentithecium fluviatile CBS 122367]|uniref:HEAT repeat protein-like protein n=1 Tax=Lentithecium fluviatile CBS 122367 TaxID=1168545 RepID=A0A6G1JAW5_9PLEO|nr:HEAT repeat protein-like protein [Lentithecium fluviatile CBS 122367]
MSRGPVVKLRAPKKTKGGTPSSRRHHFEGFSERIAKLKIEPVRRGRSTILDDAELNAAFSFFRDSFVEWRELNLSTAFTAFARQVAPLCDSLPQVLHHSDRILALLVEYIEKGDKHSEEPLLGLLAHFAHDLGVQFEKHFGQAVKTVAQLAAKHPDVEVIEWSFTCLAWLFKYLSRLLVPDLRPVFDLMAPLLGKERQKAFVTRFAAQSLSFLLRKAGAMYHRDKAPLRLIVRHISEQLKELQGTGQDIEFQRGLMTLFAEAVKGVQRGLHSSAVAITEELLRVTYDEEYVHYRTPPLEPLLVGVITAAIHHSDAEHFSPLLEPILAHIRELASDVRFLGLSSRLIFNVCGVRRGDRITQWKPFLEVISLLLDAVDNSAVQEPPPMQECLSALSVVFQYCPIDAAIPHVSVFERLTKGSWETYFLPFCNLFAELGTERFNTLLLPYFKRFIAQKAHKHGDDLCRILPSLYRSGTLSAASLQPSALWQDAIVQRFEELAQSELGNDDPRLSFLCSSILDAIGTLNLPQASRQSISKHLDHALRRSLEVSNKDAARAIDILATGKGFQFLIAQSDDSSSLTSLWPSLCSASAIYGHYLPFWRALLSVAEKNKADLEFQGSTVESLKPGIMRCLGSPSHEMRLAALSLLQIITADQSEQVGDIMNAALIIEQTPPSLDSQRSISMRIGQLARLYSNVSSHEWVGEALPTFLFGLFHVRLSSVWDDVCSALKIICESKDGEAHVSRIAFLWLTQPDSHESPIHQGTAISEPTRYASVFECTNVMQLEHQISQQQALLRPASEQLKDAFDAEHAKVRFVNSFSRAQALRLLDGLPEIAEKRSRLLVPVLLEWALDERVSNAADAEEVDHGISRWIRKDQKAMLTVFSKFKNPKVLYRAAEVHDAFLALLSNGDVEIQKSALKAILAWKDSAIAEYQENLFHLLDDARFRDEISVFLDVGSDQSLVKEEHRSRLLPVILRLLYGRVISGKQGLEAKRKAVFQALTRFEEGAIQQFLDIALGPLGGVQIIRDGALDEGVLRKELLLPRRQIGMLNMLEDMLSTLKTTFVPFVGSVVDPILYCLIKASRTLSASPVANDSEDHGTHEVQTAMFRTIRQRALHSLSNLFESCPEHSWAPYSSIIVEEMVNPRIQQFPIETAQSVSGLLRLFSAWSKSLLTAPFLVEHNPDVLNKIIECLEVPSAKDEVKRFVLDNILRPLISLASYTTAESTNDRILKTRIAADIIQPYSNAILSQVGNLLRKSPSRDLLDSGVQSVAELAPLVVGSSESHNMIEIAAFLLKQPSSRINGPSKFGLLKILHEFVPRCDEKEIVELFGLIFDAVCPLFAHVKDRQARTTLCDIVQDLSASVDDLAPIASLCHDLNAFSVSRLDEPDFERRSKAFDMINGGNTKPYSLTQWKPLVYNMLYFIKDNEELSIRVNASLSLRCFIQVSTTIDGSEPFISAALLPGIHNGMRESSELVRVEYLAVMSQLVQTYPDWALIADLHVLLSADEEASFFGNILHIQGHRRLRALRRLASHASQLQSSNIYHILLPLLEHFVFNKADDDGASSLAGETVKSISALCQWLEWPQFRSLLKRYIGYLAKKEDMQKTMIKLIAGLMDSLNQAGLAKDYNTSLEGGNESSEPADGDAMDVDKPISTLTKTLPQQEKLTKDLVNNVLPELNEFLRKKDDSNVSLRVPVAIAVTKVILILPTAEIEARLPSVLLDITHILRSRAQDSRDMARNTLAEIATFTGPAYLGFILKALRIALQRGYQLHVLSFTLHNILVKLSDQLKPGALDYCLADIVDVIMDDTFGLTGQEKDAEEYISQMKEVKSSKSFDSMDIIARCTTPSHLTELVLPVKALLQEKLGARAVQKIDELLRRIGMGVLQNPTVKNRDILVFCYEMIKEADKAHNSGSVERVDPKNRKYLINLKGAAKSGARHSATSYTYKMTKFSLDILRTVLRKHEELQTPQNLSGFLPTVGDALVAGQEEVQIAAVRLLTTIIKMPMRELDENCLVYVQEAVTAIKGAPSSNAEIAQASLKLITAILRERPNVEVKERYLTQLIKRIMPDIDEPDRQGVTFGFLKAVMNRKIIMPEVYEVMDKVAAMMVTNQTRSMRDVARSSYFHFLMEYPQAKNRFKKQLEFLLKNLRYDHVEGRQSVMEALNLVLTKVGDNILQDELGLMFLPLIHSMANDDSSDCRTMVGALVKKVFERADSPHLKGFTADLRGWLEQDEDTGLKRLGIQCWGLYLEATDAKPKELGFVLEQLQSTIETCVARQDDDDWELIYYSLVVLSKLCNVFPDTMLSSNKEDSWAAIRSCVSYPHAWVKVTAAQLYGICFADLARTNGDSGLDALPLEGSCGLQLTEKDMIRLTDAFLRNLFIPNVSEELCIQSVRNLAFLARCLAANGAMWVWQQNGDEEEEDDGVEEDETNGTANGNAEASEEEWGGFSPPPETPKAKKSRTAPATAIHRLVMRLSGIIRRETKIMKLSSLYPKSATMTLLETLTNKLPIPALSSSLPYLLTTCSTLTDPATTIPRSTDPVFNDTYTALTDKAREVMNILQKRMGTQEYLKVMGDVQKGVRERREGRRQKRKVEAVTAPEKWGKEKKRRNEVKKVKRKEKSAEYRGKRRGW